MIPYLKKLTQLIQGIPLWQKLPSLIICFLIALPLNATPEQDQAAFRKHYQQRFPKLKLTDYANGVYAIDEIARQSWSAIEEFPPYETAIEEGKKLFNTAFPNGKHYADCFPHKGLGISNEYPKWSKTQGEVVTLARAINDCRIQQQESALPYEKGDMVNLLAYLAYTSRGKAINVTIPKNSPGALSAYEQGKAFYYQRHGQLNFSCATCHIQNAGKKLRSEILSASLGHTNNWPTYRLKWGEMGSLHRRFAECLTQIKAKPFPEQSVEFRNLEYFLSYMGNGVPISGPSTRK
ncbi:sulfur oxidation c-type cytochrome SoxA [Methyloglobulus sp.]|uniref:sulfur oxidation c-type cytochrome SoxA n=1 Tax=Methyloglobulus sp. TaxID=2518622 RepID=UPI0032B723F6